MYAERYQPPRAHGLGLGGALAVNGAVIAGLILAAPYVAPKDPEGAIRIIPISDPPVPPPEPEPEPRPQTRTSSRPIDHPIVVPEPVIDRPGPVDIIATNVIPETAPPIRPTVDAGPGGGVTVETPKPLPLIPASADPRFARDFQPDYPSSELRAQREGRVQVRVRIGTDGRVRAVEQLSATSPAFFEATRRQALSRWRFRPATRGGVPEESWQVLSVRFQID